MEKEYVSLCQMGPYPKIVIFAILGFCPLVGVCLTIGAIWVSYVSYVYDGNTLADALFILVYTLIPALLCYFIGWGFIARGLAQYRFTNEGLFTKYPLSKKKLVPWKEFQQVCVCYAAYTTRGERRANTVICCVKKGEKKNMRRRWKTDSLFRYRSVICIDYQPTLLEGLKDVYPGEVVDLRDTPQYRLK